MLILLQAFLLDFLLQLEKLDPYAFLHSFLVFLQGVDPDAKLSQVTIRVAVGLSSVGQVVGPRRACFLFGGNKVFMAIKFDLLG